MAGVAVLLTFGCMVAGFCALVTVAYVAYQVVDHYVDGSSALQIPQIDDNVVPFPLPPQNNNNKKQEGPIQIVPPIAMPKPAPKNDDDLQPGKFYGADIFDGDPWKIRTGPMTAIEAEDWVRTQNKYGKNATWGLYTVNVEDAYSMAFRLGGWKPIWEGNNAGQYDHFHTANHVLFDTYKHFHVWYGNLR